MIETLLELVKDPGARRHAPEWLASLMPGRTALSGGVPWLSFRAREWLDSYLTADMRVFEYGSGGSTIYLARRAGELVSVEHDEAWYARVSRVLASADIGNCDYLLRPPEAMPSDDSSSVCTSNMKEWWGLSFNTYVRTIDRYPDGYFDLVLVDGRARPFCIEAAARKVRVGGCILLDDSQRRAYSGAKSFMSEHARRDFRGVRPYGLDVAHAVAWAVGVAPEIVTVSGEIPDGILTRR